jgi:DNA (cytosine-5)-methyltransferase 1
MNVVSLFSGVGGFDLGLEQAGMKTIYQCEWDKHATNILQRHWPDVPKWGDITTLTAQEILRHGQNPDVIAWGSPCQDLSVAGKRAGLEGERSGLFHEGMRIIKELRKETNNAYPRISIWENVAGALSSNRGADFGIILDEMAQAGAMVIEWAMLDAQHFGIPQRRRRVFVIAIFDPAIARNCPDPLLPVSQSLRGNTQKGKQKRQVASSQASTSVGENGAILGSDIVGPLAASDWKFPQQQQVHENKIVVEPYVKSRRAQSDSDDETWVEGKVNPTLNSFDTGDTRSTTAIVTNEVVKDPVGTLQARVAATNHESIRDGHAIITETHLIDGTRVDDVRVYEPPVQTLQARMGTGGNNVPMIAQEPIMLNFQGSKGNSITSEDGVSFTLNAMHGHDVHVVAQEPIGIQGNVIGRQPENGPAGKGHTEEGDPMFTLTSTDVHAVAYDEFNDTLSETHHSLRTIKISTGVLVDNEVVGTLRSGGDGGVPSSRGEHLVTEPTMAVRRLTPLECERLMGWPDDHTRYKADGTEQADTHRYKQCGNGVASPVAKWIAQHILNIPK